MYVLRVHMYIHRRVGQCLRSYLPGPAKEGKEAGEGRRFWSPPWYIAKEWVGEAAPSGPSAAVAGDEATIEGAMPMSGKCGGERGGGG